MSNMLERSTARAVGSPAGEAADDQAPLYETAVALLRHARVMMLVPTAVFALVMINGYLHRELTAQSKITPQSKDNSALSGLMGVAAQVGVSLPGSGQQNESVDFYVDLIKSREVLDSLALTSFRFATDVDETDTLSGTYVDLAKIKGKTQFDRLAKARRKLAGKVTATVKHSSGLVTVQTKAKWGRLAEQMNRRILDLVNEFNLTRRQTAARAEREFLERRLAEVDGEMKAAQGAVRAFLEHNRLFQDDPRLSLESQNLNRKVGETQQAYQALVQQYEEARADEVRNTPVITIVETPEGSRKRASGLWLNGALGLIAGTLLAAGISLALEYAAAERIRNPEAYGAFRTLWAGLPRRFLRGNRT